jgi:hypothetical protein
MVNAGRRMFPGAGMGKAALFRTVLNIVHEASEEKENGGKREQVNS